MKIPGMLKLMKFHLNRKVNWAAIERPPALLEKIRCERIQYGRQ